MKNLVLLAVQGAGKGTLAKMLSEKYGYVHISMGDILRERAQVGDELGNSIKNMIDNGIFVPNETIFEAIEYKITSPECANGYILDGFPRNIEQARGYDELLKKLNKDLGIVINMTIPEELLTQRIIGRRMCKECGAIYNIYSDEMKPKKDGVCDKCGGELYQREDQKPEVVQNRLKVYSESAEELINHYKNSGVLYDAKAGDKAGKTSFDVAKEVEEYIKQW